MDSQGAKQGGRPPSLDVCEPSDPHLDAIRFVKFLSGRLLRPEVGPKTERAAWLLLLLSRQPAHTSILLKCCAVEALVEVVQRLPPPWDQQSPGPGALPGEPWVAASASPQANVVEYATGALAQLAQRDYACRASISESGAVESLVLLLAEGPDCVAAENAVMVLHCLAASTPAMRDEVREAGGIPALVDLLQEAPLAHNVVLTRSIFWALICLADQHPLNQAAIWDAGGCRALLSIMQGGSFLNPQAREASGILALALRCFSVLMQDSSDTQFAVHRMGVVPQVVRLLQSCVATLGMTAEELEASWRRSVAALVGAWALLMEVHRRVAEAADGKRMLPRGTGDTALGIWTAIIEEEEEGSGEEEGGEGYPDPPLSLREEEGVAGEWEVCDEALEGILEEFGPPEEAQDVYPELPDETAELPAKMMRLDEEIGESLELKRNVWEAWRSIPMELMMRVVPGSGRRLHPAREALRSLRALVTSCKSGPAQAKEAGALPLLVEALRLQLDAGRALSEFALEPAEVISAIVAGSPAAKEELRKAGGVELLVRMLPLPQVGCCLAPSSSSYPSAPA